MLDIFAKAGYTIDKEVLNAWDYGVPQKRERLITIGIRNDLKGDINYSFPKAHDYNPVLRDVLLDCPKGPGVPYGDKKRKIFELVPPGGYWRDIDPKIAKDYMKSCWEMEGDHHFHIIDQEDHHFCLIEQVEDHQYFNIINKQINL